jgi:hypothetical protein
MFEQIRTAIDALEAVVRDLEPGIVDGPGATRLMELFVRGEHVCAAGKALATRRVAETGAYRDAGQRSAGHLLAAVSGVSVGAADALVRTVERLDDLPATNEAFRAGQLSEAQAREISYAASQDASCEGQLLRSAKRRTLKGLKEDCQRVVAASVDDDAEWAQRLHDSRAVYRWAEPGGALRLDARLAPDVGAKVFSALDAETDRIFREARAAGQRDPRAAYMADALAHLIANGPTKPIDVRMSLDAAPVARGHVLPGERCEIDGIGPIPVTTARQMLADARVTTMVRDGDAITHVSSMTRTVPAKLRRWLEETYPECGRNGCDNTIGLIIDHIVDYAILARIGEIPPTTEDNTWRLCPTCNDLKTYRGWKVTGGPGTWDLIPPEASDDPDPP